MNPPQQTTGLWSYAGPSFAGEPEGAFSIQKAFTSLVGKAVGLIKAWTGGQLRGRRLDIRMSIPSTDASGLGELRQRNRLRVLAALRRGRPLSQADISRATALSRTTVSSVIRDLKRGACPGAWTHAPWRSRGAARSGSEINQVTPRRASYWDQIATCRQKR